VSERAIFRESALEAHRRRTETDIVPRLIARPIIVCFWILLGALVTAALIAWSVQVPTYVGASGVILGPSKQPHTVGGETAVALFLPPDQSAPLRVGQPVHVQIGSSGAYVRGDIATVEPGLIGPDAARERYGIEGGANLIAQPSIVVVVRLRRALSPATYGGSSLSARVELGSQRLLALFPGLGKLVGGAS
jgi:hypothetical protein